MINDPLYRSICEYEAQQRWKAGEQPGFSSDIGGFITCGYGKLDDYGIWQFPLYPGEYYLKQLNK